MNAKRLMLPLMMAGAALYSGTLLAERLDTAAGTSGQGNGRVATGSQAAANATLNAQGRAAASVDKSAADSAAATGKAASREAVGLGGRLAGEARHSGGVMKDTAMGAGQTVSGTAQGATRVGASTDGQNAAVEQSAAAAAETVLDSGAGDTTVQEGKRLGTVVAAQAQQSAGNVRNAALRLASDAADTAPPRAEIGLDAALDADAALNARAMARDVASLQQEARNAGRDTVREARGAISDTRRQLQDTRSSVQGDLSREITGQVRGAVEVQGALR